MKLPEGWQLVPVDPTPEMIHAAFAGQVLDQSLPNQMRRNEAMRQNYEKMLAAAPTPPEQEDEPVGFMWRKKGTSGKWKCCSIEHLGDWEKKMTEYQFLYTRPDSSKLRKAAEALLFAYDNSEYCINEVKDLRAALDE